jgi:hypothetical protein
MSLDDLALALPESGDAYIQIQEQLLSINLSYVDAVTGSGKTRAATDLAVSLPGANFCFVMPTRKLINNTVSDLRERHPSAWQRVEVLVSGSAREPVTSRIVEFIKQVHPDQGRILFITHEAFMRIPHWHLARHWHLVVDEVPQVTYCETFTLSENRDRLLELLSFGPHDEDYLEIEARQHSIINAAAKNRKRDQITALFQALAGKLTSSSQWQLFVEREQFERFSSGRISQIEVHGLLHPSIFQGFATVTLMAANLRESLMYHYFSNVGCTFKENRRIGSRLRYAAHGNGDRLSIHFLTGRVWSKSLRDQAIEIDGEPMTVGDVYLNEIKRVFGEQPYLWIGNNDVGNVLDGVRLPNIPHGLNNFQGYHRCAVVSALNPTKVHGKFLQSMAGISERQVRRAILSQLAYQAVGRGSLRNPTSDERFTLIVPDRDTVDDVAEMYPGCDIRQLSSAICVPAPGKTGRKAKYDSDAARKAAARKRRSWKDQQIEFGTKLPSIDSFVSPSEHGFVLSLWRKYDTRRWENQRHLSTDRFFAYLRDRFKNREYGEKAENYLCSPTMFRENWKGHTLENAAYVQGIVMDLDDTDMTPEDIAMALPEVEMVIVSSWSHCPDEHCYRIYIPTTMMMSSDASKAIRMTIVDRFRKAGFADKDQLGPQHGTDMTKLHSAALFFLPSKRPGGFLNEYRGEERKPIDPNEWVETCPPAIVDRIIGQRILDEHALAQEGSPIEGYAERQQAGFEKAVQIWHSHHPGEGNDKFNRLAWRLHGYRMSLPDIEQKLREEAHCSRSPSDRLNQILYIMKGIRQHGSC